MIFEEEKTQRLRADIRALSDAFRPIARWATAYEKFLEGKGEPIDERSCVAVFQHSDRLFALRTQHLLRAAEALAMHGASPQGESEEEEKWVTSEF